LRQPIATILRQSESLNQSFAVDADLDPRILTRLAIEETQIDALLAELGAFGEKEE